MDLAELKVFLMVAAERSFSGAARKLHRTQPAVSQAVRRLEDELGERLFDRSFKDGALTDAGRVLQGYAERLLRLSEEAEGAVREFQDLRRGRVLIGANEAGVHSLLPLLERFREAHPQSLVDVRRVPSRQIGLEVLQRGLDFGVLTFEPAERGLASLALGADELVLLTPPVAPAGAPAHVTLRGPGRQPSSRTTIRRRRASGCCGSSRSGTTAQIRISLPSLDGIKRAVEMDRRGAAAAALRAH